jgi:phage/plasmid-associated DNA primase
MNIGHTASNGKSTEMSIHEKCFELYSMKADSRVLQLNFEKRHKFLNDLVHKPIRFLYFEELPKGKKLDVEFIKDFVDGKKLTLEKMFGTTDKFKIQAKFMSASNHDFEVDTDEGILRRGRVQYYESKFIDDLNCVDETNHIYSKEEGFENKFNDNDYKNAYFHLLLKYVDELYVPNKNKEDFKQKAEEGDNILNHILEHFEITNNINDTVGKSEIENVLVKDHFKDIKDKLQSKGCKYDSQKRYWCEVEKKQKKGVFTNIKTLA